MKVIEPPFEVFSFEFIPRSYPIVGDISIEITKELSDISVTAVYTPALQNKGYYNASIDITPLGIVSGDSLTIKITSNDEVIYRGKAYATDQTDLEKYTLTPINDNVIEL